MAGIINGQIDQTINADGTVGSDQAAAPAAPKVVNAPGSTNWQVDPSTMTVQGQMNGLLDPNSQVMQKAQADARATAANSGMLNSSMASTGATAAMIDKATQIGSLDAGTYVKSASDNAGNATSIQNTGTSAAASMYGADKSAAASMYGADKSSAASMYGADKSAAASKYSADTSASTQLATNAATNATTVATNKLTNDTSIANTTANNAATQIRDDKLTAAKTSDAAILAANTGAQAAYNTYANTLNNITQNDKMDANAKAAAYDQATATYSAAIAGYKASGAAVPDASSLLNFGTMPTVSQAAATTGPPTPVTVNPPVSTGVTPATPVTTAPVNYSGKPQWMR